MRCPCVAPLLRLQNLLTPLWTTIKLKVQQKFIKDVYSPRMLHSNAACLSMHQSCIFSMKSMNMNNLKKNNINYSPNEKTAL